MSGERDCVVRHSGVAGQVENCAQTIHIFLLIDVCLLAIEVFILALVLVKRTNIDQRVCDGLVLGHHLL